MLCVKNSSLVKSQSHSAVSSIFHPIKCNKIAERNGLEGEEDVTDRLAGGGLRRSTTQPLHVEEEEDMSGYTIQERLAKLQKSGREDWRKRITRPTEELTRLSPVNIILNERNNELNSPSPAKDLEVKPGSPSILADRMGKLEAATRGWKKRVPPSDASKFSVEGRMLDKTPTLSLSLSPLTQRKKRSPKAMKFKSRVGPLLSSTPSSPLEKNASLLFRSISAPGGHDDGLSGIEELTGPTVTVPRADDETFTSFFSSVSSERVLHERIDIESDLDVVVRTDSSRLLVQKRNIQMQRRRATMKNPLRALKARTDLQEEYIEIKTGVAEKELKRMKVEKLSKNSNLAIEALAALASNEDFTAVNLKKGCGVVNSTMLPYKDLMLLQIKGRRHVQTRLVEPTYTSINEGDNFILVTPNCLFNYVGEYSNVIERSRAAEIAQTILQKRDLGCTNASTVVTIGPGGRPTEEQVKQFWKLLGANSPCQQEAGHPDEDELYEIAVADTNMIYELVDDGLEPLHQYWGCVPKIDVLDPNKIIVFDFGCELYVWAGKNTNLPTRKQALNLVKELWGEGYDYTDCDVCPLLSAFALRAQDDSKKCYSERPDWAILAKVTQHMETILFREKFLDWPDYSRVIRTRRKSGEETEVDGNGCIELKPCDAGEMLCHQVQEPDLQLENSHLGRGLGYFDEETRRQNDISTQSIEVWHIQEYGRCLLPEESLGQFHMGDSYVVKWSYNITVTGRELSGLPSKHLMLGRDRSVYFCWQGADAPIVDQGAAALQTVELDEDRNPHVRLVQGHEYPAFLNLFKGSMVIYLGRREEECYPKWRLFICRGEMGTEAVLVEVQSSMRHLRSCASFVLVNVQTGLLIIWHGNKVLEHTKKIAREAANNLAAKKPSELKLEVEELRVREEYEGRESKDFLIGVGGDNRQLYCSLTDNDETKTPRLFHLTSILGEFSWTEVTPSYYNAAVVNPYPFLQSDLYSASQPALFLLDAGATLWIWQGWSDEENSERGSNTVRYQEERRAGMNTALAYWLQKYGDTEVKAYLVWAGLEPLEFTNLFPIWMDRDDIAEINIQNGRKAGELLEVKNELSRLTQSTYPLAQLLQRPLPEGVDPTVLEEYLEPQTFVSLLNMTKEEFCNLPIWKKNELKKKIGLF